MPLCLCPYCKARNVVIANTFEDRVQCESCAKLFLLEIKDGRTTNVTPANLIIDPPSDLDKQLVSDLNEVCATYNVEAFKASVVMARRFLEALLDKRGIKGRTLADRIKAAHQSGAIPTLTYQLASSARILGNYGAHYSDDQLNEIGADEAELVINIIRQILKRLS